MANQEFNLIAIAESTIGADVVQTVNARDLHAFLEVKSRFNDLMQRQIEFYGFTQDVDFITILAREYSPPRKEYHVTIDMAKELAMVERNDKGREARQYFLAVEKAYRSQQNQFDLATMTSQALRQLASTIEENAALKTRIQVMQPKEEFFDHVVGTSSLFTLKDAAQSLRTGQKRLVDKLVEWKMFGKERRPYQKYIDNGYFQIIPTPYKQGNFTLFHPQPMVTGKGFTIIKGMMDATVMSQSRELAKV